MKKSRFDRDFYRFVQCVIIWFLVIFIVGLCAGTIYTWNERRLYFDETHGVEKVQRYNAFWTALAGETTPPDGVVGNFASDLREYADAETPSSSTVDITVDQPADTSTSVDTTESGYNPLVIGSLEEFIAPIDVYDGFEKQSGINAFGGLEVGDNTVNDAGALHASFVANVQQALSGNTAGLLHDEPTHEHEKLPWIRTDLIFKWYLLVGVVAFFLGGLHIECNSGVCNRLHYTLRGWHRMNSDDIGYAFVLIFLCPIMFGVWVVGALIYTGAISIYMLGIILYHLINGDMIREESEDDSQADITAKLLNELHDYRTNLGGNRDDEIVIGIERLERLLEQEIKGD